jgi:hypothetical protein
MKNVMTIQVQVTKIRTSNGNIYCSNLQGFQVEIKVPVHYDYLALIKKNIKLEGNDFTWH